MRVDILYHIPCLYQNDVLCQNWHTASGLYSDRSVDMQHDLVRMGKCIDMRASIVVELYDHGGALEYTSQLYHTSLWG